MEKCKKFSGCIVSALWLIYTLYIYTLYILSSYLGSNKKTNFGTVLVYTTLGSTCNNHKGSADLNPIFICLKKKEFRF